MTFSLPTPQDIPIDSVPALRWGVIGTGIADRFVTALHAHTAQRAVAVTARDVAKTRAFAHRHGIGTVLPSVEALVASPDVDVVYVSTPHPLHHDQALAAIAAGKHVLIEKPIAMSADEAQAIVDAGRAAGVLVMEAMWTRYLPQSSILRQVIADGVIGDVRLVIADFGFVAPDDRSNRLWDPALGGGALLDAGVYPISFASSVIGPLRLVSASGSQDGDVDSSAALAVTGRGGADGLLATSLVAALPVEARVAGSAGHVRMLSPFFGPTGIEVTLGGIGSEEVATWRDGRFDALHDGLGYQATAFASYVAEGRLESPLHPHDEVVQVMRVIDDARGRIAAS
ncbi:Gfo/Idh/MocA family protein [uncultured Amnibacterium sp.]|uniref:Gfo/Idh/MocA family protein n=1 Tax=uncultured Amnibacterium sp. TaxID=1631851 RepID=UPI0035CB8CC9